MSAHCILYQVWTNQLGTFVGSGNDGGAGVWWHVCVIIVAIALVLAAKAVRSSSIASTCILDNLAKFQQVGNHNNVYHLLVVHNNEKVDEKGSHNHLIIEKAATADGAWMLTEIA